MGDEEKQQFLEQIAQAAYLEENGGAEEIT